jgi:exodeoxyribonuclease V alpha subunit
MVRAARDGRGEEALAWSARVKVLSATRKGPLGLDDWTDRIEAGVAGEIPRLGRSRRWYAGRPVIATANDRINGVFNGDVGVAVAVDGAVSVLLRSDSPGGGAGMLAPSRLDRVESWWAMTIHKSQGSEFPHAVVSLPRASSPILTRELLYTGVTRARERLTVVGAEESLRAAVSRPIARASGLRDRLWT